jgi:Domain of Unknown Function (DUF1206)
MSNAASATRSARGARAENSEALDKGARLGLVSYGVVHLVIGWLALQLAFGDRSQNASQSGAFAQLAKSGLGQLVLYVVALGFAALVVWQVVEALWGHRSDDGAKRALKCAASAGKAIVYGVLGFGALKVALGEGQGSSGTQAWTAKLMSAPGGQVLVAAVGLGVAGVGAFLVWKGFTEKFTKDLDSGATARDRRTPIVVLGKVGYIAKGLTLGVVGVLFLVAALTHNAARSGGLDKALTTLLHQPFGPFLVGGMALGLAAFGLFCFAWARHLRR